MKALFRALWTLLTPLFLALIGQPVPGQSRAERERSLRQTGRVQTETEQPGAFATLRTVTREAFYALIAQPSPGERSAASRHRPRP